MSDKTFWSIVGGLLLGWVVLFYVLVLSGGMKEYKDKSAELTSKVKAMKKYSGMPAEALPTEKLLGRETAFIEGYEASLQDAQRFFEDRENRLFAGVSTDSKASWEGTYRDQYALLGARYRAVNPLEEGGDPESFPFDKIDSRVIDSDLSQAERIWRTQKLVVDSVLDAGGEIVRSGAVSRSALNAIAKVEGDSRPRFGIDQVTTLAMLPASEITPMMTEILGHSGLNLEVARMVVGKDPKTLIFEKVVEKGAVKAEPQVLLSLSLNVLKFTPKPTE